MFGWFRKKAKSDERAKESAPVSSSFEDPQRNDLEPQQNDVHALFNDSSGVSVHSEPGAMEPSHPIANEQRRSARRAPGGAQQPDWDALDEPTVAMDRAVAPAGPSVPDDYLRVAPPHQSFDSPAVDPEERLLFGNPFTESTDVVFNTFQSDSTLMTPVAGAQRPAHETAPTREPALGRGAAPAQGTVHAQEQTVAPAKDARERADSSAGSETPSSVAGHTPHPSDGKTGGAAQRERGAQAAPAPLPPVAGSTRVDRSSYVREEDEPELIPAPSALPAMPLSDRPNFAGLGLIDNAPGPVRLLEPSAALGEAARDELKTLLSDLFGSRGRYRLEWRPSREAGDDAMFADIFVNDLVRRIQNSLAEVAELEAGERPRELTAAAERDVEPETDTEAAAEKDADSAERVQPLSDARSKDADRSASEGGKKKAKGERPRLKISENAKSAPKSESKRSEKDASLDAGADANDETESSVKSGADAKAEASAKADAEAVARDVDAAKLPKPSAKGAQDPRVSTVRDFLGRVAS